MLKRHETEELKGKVSASILERYNVDYQNILLSSIIAGFHRAYGFRNEGIEMSLEITQDIEDNTENLWERNILVWNLYILTRELIDDKEYEKALNYVDRLEKNWSRDVILGDEIGFYHVSWIEQIWLRKAEVYMLTEKYDDFESITDKILQSRMKFFKIAEKCTGEVIIKDRCTYSCFELMAVCERKRNIDKALMMIREAIIHKCGRFDMENIKKENYNNLDGCFDACLKQYFDIVDNPFDNCIYDYCRTCINYDRSGKCMKFNLNTDDYKSCSRYEF